MKDLDAFNINELKGWTDTSESSGNPDWYPDPWEVAALARIALAAKKAEPVAWTSQRSLETKNKIVAFTDDMSALDYGTANGWADIVELYTTPQLNSPEIPEGWKLVPIEATLAMLTLLGLTGSFESMQERYANMLAAVPESE
ncbi:TPA: hypothetical protein U5E37_003739 [Yersinia enterocolitica]|nr:hypothetical protein [Yersinia enterocolitica]